MLKHEAVGFRIPVQEAALEAVQLGQFQIQLRASGDRSISIEGKFAVKSASGLTHVDVQAGVNTQPDQAASLTPLLGKAILGLRVYYHGLLEVELDECLVETYDDRWELWGFAKPDLLFANFIEGMGGFEHMKMDDDWEYF